MYSKQNTIEKEQKRNMVALKRKQEKEKKRLARAKEEEKANKDVKEVDPQVDFAHLNRKERRIKAREHGIACIHGSSISIRKSDGKRDVFVPHKVFADSSMRIVPIHYIPALEVASYEAVREDAQEMARIMEEGVMQYEDGSRYIGNAWALHHAQVNNRPFNFFVLNRNLATPDVIERVGSHIIINPKIKNILPDMVHAMKEGCVSFQHKKEKKVHRAIIVKVDYDVPDEKSKTGLRHVSQEVHGVIAQVFQHECDHGAGKNMYYAVPK